LKHYQLLLIDLLLIFQRSGLGKHVYVSINDAREETILKRADIQSELAEWTKAWCGRVIDVKSEAAEVAIVTLPVCASRISIKVSSVGEHIYIPLEDPGADVILK
jgi:hypothetical protein